MVDIILIDDDHVELERLKKKLVDDFEIKDLGALKYFLGMECLSKVYLSIDTNMYSIYLVEQGCLNVK